jgi:hypothetical protein
MSVRDELRRQKSEGDREWAAKQSEDQRKRDDETARVREQEEKRRAAEAEKDRKKAEEVYAGLPAAVRTASARGLDKAVLADSFVTERADEGKTCRPLAIERKSYYLTGWQIPFAEMCQSDGIPLTVVTERVDVALKGVLHKTYHLLAVDLKRL